MGTFKLSNKSTAGLWSVAQVSHLDCNDVDKMLFYLQDCLPHKQNKLKKIALLYRLKTHLISLNQTGGVNSVSIRLLLSESCVIWTVN